MRKSTTMKIIFVTMFMFFAMNTLVMAQIHYDPNGNVGIGTTSPAHRLHVNGGNLQITGDSSGGDGMVIFKDPNGKEIGRIGYDNGVSNGDVLSISHGDNLKGLIIDNNGRVGVGNRHVGFKSNVFGGIEETDPDNYIDGITPYNMARFHDVDVLNNELESIFSIRGRDGAIYLTADTNYTGALAFVTRISWDYHERMRITSDGNVGIGTTTPEAKLHVEGTIEVDQKIQANDSGGLELATDEGITRLKIIDDGTIIVYQKIEANGSGGLALATDDGTTRLKINDNGNIGIGTTSPSYSLHVVGDIAYTGNIYDISDIRLKENISPLENALEKVSSIDAIYFNNIGTKEKREIGVIAQDVEKVLPEIVSEDKDGYKVVDYSKLTPLLIEAVKELKAQNEEMAERIKALENR